MIFAIEASETASSCDNSKTFYNDKIGILSNQNKS